ncbi:nitrogenase cofactor biosynthesis protein NifB [Gluconacetobacter azotocaptans]|uniref:FeMo cofactor biosynthesis protein NifB n=1 Tax=Gluconacetobacter azotocaptans TaxID=142834 RepID=A0A7W4JT00_9PROT|nr:nitrogenase cofactor biosynthesis protein NifB [Gluconacetobacter azotocaptans]MBB2190386.1 nitrogenase cofactor biosynthesis protein NifB [Gluconacetobacter azotocaptans]MBM9400577.1 nitrogenase cofactor biosynthesis protein NifB [Gluconacetobacter azotocaptans]
MAQLVGLETLMPAGAQDMRAALDGQGCSSSSCGSSSGPSDMPAEIWEKVKDHPCYSEEAHHYFARMHVAVAPACNIQCNYCNRKYDCANESRPGVVSEKLTPVQARRKVISVANEVPQLSVLGIAGPGDACYDWRKTRETFELISADIPDIKLCLSTNGLMLPDRVDEIERMNIDHVTITINMVDPEIGTKIYPWIFYQNRRWTGLDASKILHERQMLGLEMLTARGILTKINSVMIPGVNDQHLMEVNRVVKGKGAFLHNIMPLISDPAHGTHYGLTGQRGPRAMELKALQDKLSDGTKLMRHCRQCRADAVGLLGEDRGQEFTMDLVADEVEYDPTKRETYREVVAEERGQHVAARQKVDVALASVDADEAMLVAVATKGGGRINQHFGHAKEFQIYEVSPAGVTFVGHRKAEQYCEGGWGEDATLDGVIAALEGVRVILCAKIGDCPRESLSAAGIEATDAFAHDWIEAGISGWYAREHASYARQIA